MAEKQSDKPDTERVVAAFIGHEDIKWQGCPVMVTANGDWWVYSANKWVKDFPSPFGAVPESQQRNEAEGACRDIFHDYDKSEIGAKPPSVQRAWQVGGQLVADEAATPVSAKALSEPSAWSPISKRGLLRGIRFGTPTVEDLAIAEADGDTIRYFYDATPVSTSGPLPNLAKPDTGLLWNGRCRECGTDAPTRCAMSHCPIPGAASAIGDRG